MEHHSSVVYYRGILQSDKIAAFDLDGTLITLGPGAGRKKAAAASSSWEWWNPVVSDRLISLNNDGYTIVIFSNQSGLSGKTSRDQLDILDKKIQQIVEVLGFKPFFYFASAYDKYRKPAIGMWELFIEHTKLKSQKAYFVGDAAGRHGDHAASDLYFAHNCKLQFYTPESYFLDKKLVLGKTIYDTHPEYFTNLIIPSTEYNKKIDDFMVHFDTSSEITGPFAIFMCGPPASGKTSLAHEIEKHIGATWINQDTCKTKTKMFSAIKSATTSGESIIIDKTFGDKESRKEYLEKIPKNYKSIIIVMTINREQTEHLNWVRVETFDVPAINDIVYATYYKHFSKPTKDEGFYEILEWESQIASNSKSAKFIKRYYV